MLLPTSEDKKTILDAVPEHIIDDIKEECPWLLELLKHVDDRLNRVEEAVTSVKKAAEADHKLLSANSKQIAENTATAAASNQYLMRNSLIFHNLDDIPHHKRGAEFSKYAANKINELFPDLNWLGRKVMHGDIDTIHPLKNRRRNFNSNMVIVKFKVRDLKNIIYCNKSHIANKTVTISEHLTRKSLSVLKRAKKHSRAIMFGPRNDWFMFLGASSRNLSSPIKILIN